MGGLGVAPGANIGGDLAVFEAVHGSAPDIAGRDVANPVAMMRSAILMLRWLDMPEIADRLGKAIRTVFVDKRIRTRDLGGTASTSEFTEAVVRELDEARELQEAPG